MPHLTFGTRVSSPPSCPSSLIILTSRQRHKSARARPAEFHVAATHPRAIPAKFITGAIRLLIDDILLLTKWPGPGTPRGGISAFPLVVAAGTTLRTRPIELLVSGRLFAPSFTNQTACSEVRTRV